MSAVSLAYKEIGSGEPLLIIHGLFGSGRNWASLAKRFAETHRVFLLDVRNHGQSPWSDEMTYGAMAEDILEFVKQHQLPKVSIVGHSMGGKAAMTFALLHPQRVNKLVAVDIAPVNYKVKLGNFITAMQQLDLSGALSRVQMQQALDKVTESPGISMFLLSSLQREDGGYCWRMNLDVLDATLDSEISRFPQHSGSWNGPTLFLDGETSAYIRDKHHPEIFRLFPEAKIQPIADAGHWLHSEQPEKTYLAISQFLANQDNHGNSNG
jgi:pimeloyl-ACP methyl ester carboxylesterase